MAFKLLKEQFQLSGEEGGRTPPREDGSHDHPDCTEMLLAASAESREARQLTV